MENAYFVKIILKHWSLFLQRFSISISEWKKTFWMSPNRIYIFVNFMAKGAHITPISPSLCQFIVSSDESFERLTEPQPRWQRITQVPCWMLVILQSTRLESRELQCDIRFESLCLFRIMKLKFISLTHCFNRIVFLRRVLCVTVVCGLVLLHFSKMYNYMIR